MATENGILPATNVTTSELVLTLSKEGLAYQQLLQDANDIVFTNDNLNEQRIKLQGIQKLESKIKGLVNPHTEKWQKWNESRKGLLDPVTEVKVRKESEFKKKADENTAAAAKIEAEKQRVAGIKSAIDTFFLEQSQAIAAAKTPEELVLIQKTVGSHSGNKSRYAEFLPLLVSKAANLAELIKVQKEAIKILQGLKTAENAAEAIGDDETVLALREQQEGFEAKISQNRDTVQQTAINMATQPDVVEPEVVVVDAPKARRSVWVWEVQNIKTVGKVMPEWIEMRVIDSKIDDYLKSKKAEGIEGEQFFFAGCRFFLEKSY